jgi:hypothetical protein
MIERLSVRQGSYAALGSMIPHRSLLSTGGFSSLTESHDRPALRSGRASLKRFGNICRLSGPSACRLSGPSARLDLRTHTVEKCIAKISSRTEDEYQQLAGVESCRQNHRTQFAAAISPPAKRACCRRFAQRWDRGCAGERQIRSDQLEPIADYATVSNL